jgi:hypothetical protein
MDSNNDSALKTHERLQDELLDQQSNMLKEHHGKQVVQPIHYKFGSYLIAVPGAGSLAAIRIDLPKESTRKKQVIFFAMHHAAHEFFFTDKHPYHKKTNFLYFGRKFLDYISDLDNIDEITVNLLKLFETHRVKVDKVKTQSSGLAFIKNCIQLALSKPEFYRNLSNIEQSYLAGLTKVKAAARDESTQKTLTAWFGEHGWLRREDVGIGHELYSRVASPRILIQSFRIMVASSLIGLQSAKNVLLDLLQDANITSSDLELFQPSEDFSSKAEYSSYNSKVLVNLLQKLKIFHDKHIEKSIENKQAILILIRSLVSDPVQKYIEEAFFSQGHLNHSYRQRRIWRSPDFFGEPLFSISFLSELIDYGESSKKANIPVPVCFTENLFFKFLMADQTVPRNDINKLTGRDFRFLKNRRGKVTHIDFEYFKSRSRKRHETRIIDTKTQIGQALLSFLDDRITHHSIDKPLVRSDFNTKIEHNFGPNTPPVYGIVTCIEVFHAEISDRMYREKASNVFPKAIIKMVNQGKVYRPNIHKKREIFLLEVETPLTGSLFSISAIKNSSIHSKSANFDPSQLINFNSHSNSIERKFYLSPENEEWLNNCGLVTRMVMLDLAKNLFSFSKAKDQKFNHQFQLLTEFVETNSMDTSVRIQVIDEKDAGKADRLGLCRPVGLSSAPTDAIFIVDAKETVMKLLHYLGEAKKNYTLVGKNNPDYLLYTMLPTIEWIENLFDLGRFSPQSVDDGERLFNLYGESLPPLFLAQTG